MHHDSASQLRVLAISIVLFLSLTHVAEAIDGVVLIDQNRALTGNVTPGDFPGFPVTISRTGSYRLSGNLQVADPDTTAIEITASNVTLDLNGFTVQGPADICSGSIVPSWCFTGAEGIGVLGHGGGVSPILTGIALINGTVRAMARQGVFLGRGSRVEKLVVEHNRDTGIEVFSESTVSGNYVNRNLAYGIRTTGSLILGNVIMDNGDLGIFGGSDALANNVLRSNNAGGQQISGSNVQIGGNVCGVSACP